VPARAREAGISWPLPDDLGDAALECRLYPALRPRPRTAVVGRTGRRFNRELRRKGVTLAIGVEEYRATHPDGYSRSRFCELYRALGRPPVADRCGRRTWRREAVRRLCRHDDRHF